MVDTKTVKLNSGYVRLEDESNPSPVAAHSVLRKSFAANIVAHND